MSRRSGCRRVAIGCLFAMLTLVFLAITTLLAAIPFALHRRPGPSIEVQLTVRGGSWPSDSSAVATYIPALQLPQMAQPLQAWLDENLRPPYLTLPAVTVTGEQLSLQLPSGFSSIRKEQLSSLRINGVTLQMTQTAPAESLPEPGSEPMPETNPMAYAQRDDDIARFTENGAFLPTPLWVQRDELRRVEIIIETDPVVLTGFRTGIDGLGWQGGRHEATGAVIEGHTLSVPAGSVFPIALYRTGIAGYPHKPSRLDDDEVNTQVIVIDEQILLETIGWRQTLPQIPLTSEELDTLYTIRDLHFPTVVESIDGQPVASIAVPADAVGSRALLVFSAHAPDMLAGAQYLRLVIAR